MSNAPHSKEALASQVEMFLRDTGSPGIIVKSFLDDFDSYRERLDELEKDNDATEQDAIDLTYAHMPHFRDIDMVIDEFNQTSMPDDYSAIRGLSFLALRTSSSTPHIDCPVDMPEANQHAIAGPILMSLRIDNDFTQNRTFYLVPWSSKKDITQLSIRGGWLQHDPRRHPRKYKNLATNPRTISLQQNPGDLVIFKGFPRPPIHSVRGMGTTAMITGYQYIGDGELDETIIRMRKTEKKILPWRWRPIEDI